MLVSLCEGAQMNDENLATGCIDDDAYKLSVDGLFAKELINPITRRYSIVHHHMHSSVSNIQKAYTLTQIDRATLLSIDWAPVAFLEADWLGLSLKVGQGPGH